MLAEIDQFVNRVRRRNPDARTWIDYGYDLRQFTALVGDVPPNAITFRDVDRFVSQQAGDGYKPNTINRRLATLVAFYAFLSDEDPRLVCPVLMHRHHLRERQALPRPVQESDLRAFFAAIEAAIHAHPPEAIRDRAMFTLMLRCGLRKGEVEELRQEDLDFGGRRLTVRNGKGQADRTVYLAEGVERALREYLHVRGMGPTDHVFLYRNQPLSKGLVHDRLKACGERVGVAAHAHRLRHTCATQLLNAGCRVTSIQKLLGHKKLNTTMIYARAYDQTVEEDYFRAMSSVEKRLELIGQPEENGEPVSEDERGQILALTEKLAEPELSAEARLVIAAQIRLVLLGEMKSFPLKHLSLNPIGA